ncbi:MAG: molybdopterin molybdotransferase [Thermoproteota archaeon]|nr:molybdopterin molybdotransferase [Thermoproteota archaeon]
MDTVKMKGFKKLTRVDDALNEFLVKGAMRNQLSETVRTFDALGRILAENVIAGTDVPAFDRSAVDGYVVKAEETYGASPTNPIIFDVVGTVEIGFPSKIVLGKQEAMRIATGAAIPAGADSVVMVEYSEKIGEKKVEIYSSLPPWENVSRKGEDVKNGEELLLRGTLLQPQDIGILTALGESIVTVTEKVKVAVLSTGNELLNLGDKMENGKIVDSNRPILMAMVKELGGEPIDFGIAQDNFEEIRLKIANSIQESDMVLVSGGTSVGAGDLVPDVINSLGKPGIIVHGVSIRPGRPTGLASIGGKPVILLPGFPVAAIVSFMAFVQPIIMKIMGAFPDQFAKKTVKARMLRRVPSSIGNRTFARVIVKRVGMSYVAEPLRTSGSGVISSLIRANGLIVIPEEKEGLEEGEEVEVTILRHLEE